MKLYGEISKTEEVDDGTIKVWGYASTSNKDEQGETVTAKAMQDALPEYMKWANVREMHTAKAAGTAIEASVQEDGRCWFGAHIIDSEAVKKVKMGVYKGFSIGGKATKRNDLNKTIIEGLRLNEVSLVDRPANPEAVITIMKMSDKVEAVDELAKILDEGTVSPERIVELAKSSDEIAKAAVELAELKEKAVEAEAVAKSLSDEIEKLKTEVAAGTFVKNALDAVAKVLVDAGMVDGEKYEDFVVKLCAERNDLLAKKAEWEAKPKEGGPNLTAVPKEGDTIVKTEVSVQPVKKADGSIDEAATAIKKIHASGGQVSRY